MNFSVTKNGKPLDKSLYTWDEITKTFSSSEEYLVIDVGRENYITFKAGLGCMFHTGSFCTFKTGSWCTFDTWSSCTFNTDSDCTFNTGPDCTFDTDSDCTFNTNSDCTFKTETECVVIRRDIYEVIEIPDNTKIKLNGTGVKGYSIIE